MPQHPVPCRLGKGHGWLLSSSSVQERWGRGLHDSALVHSHSPYKCEQ